MEALIIILACIALIVYMAYSSMLEKRIDTLTKRCEEVTLQAAESLENMEIMSGFLTAEQKNKYYQELGKRLVKEEK